MMNDIDIDCTPIDELRNWVDDLDDSTSGRCYLYKLQGTKKINAGTFSLDSLPEIDDIAAIGAGDYVLQISTTVAGERKNITRRLSIDPEYSRRINSAQSAPSVAVASPPVSGMGLEQIAAVMAMLQPLLSPPDMSAQIAATWGVLSQIQQQSSVMIQNLFERQTETQIEMIKRIREIENHREEVEEMEEREIGTAEKILSLIAPMIDKFLPLLVNPASAGMVKSMVTGTPEYRELTEHPEAIPEVIAGIERSHGAEAAAAVGRLVQ
jgi:hypothetical protein